MKKNSASSITQSKVVLKSYSKILLFYPLFIYSIVAFILQYRWSTLGLSRPPILAIIWIFIFFMNMVVVGFDFPTAKFLVLFLVIIVIILALILLDMFGIISLFAWWAQLQEFFAFSNDPKFYGWILITLGVLILAAVLQAQAKFVRLESNEIYIKGLASGKVERFPILNLQVDIEITDVFEFLSLGAGTLTFRIGSDKIIPLRTVPRVKKKKKLIDQLLTQVKPTTAP